MRLAAVALCGLVAPVWADAGPAEQELYDETNVITLEAADLSQVDTLPTPMLVDFFAPWCGHCKHLTPAYARAADMVLAEGGDVTLAKFDATTHGPTAKKYGAHGYPTLVLFNKDGTSENLRQLGPHNDAWIATWLRRRVTGTATKRLASLQDVREFRAIAEVVCVLFSDSDGDTTAQTEVFEDVAKRWEDPSLRWGIAPAALQSEFSAHWRRPAVALFRQTGDTTAAMDAPGWDETKLVNFVQKKDVPYLVRRIVLLNTWSHFVVLLGEHAASKHEHPYRQVYDFAAKDQEIAFDSNIISSPDACNWILAAGGSDQTMNMREPTAAYFFVEKGIVKRVELYGKPLIGAGLTIGSKGEPGTATQALAEWARQFGPRGTLHNKSSGSPSKETEAKLPSQPTTAAMKETTKKLEQSQASNVDSVEVPKAPQGVGAAEKQATKSKHPRAGKKKAWHATVDSIKDPEERAHAEAKYRQFDDEEPNKQKQKTHDEL